MLKALFNKIVSSVRYFFRHLIKPRLLDWRYRDILKRNLALKDIHKGKRCFLMGSGPSIKDMDLKVLANEYVISVNGFYKHPDFEKLNHVYHIFGDQGILNEYSVSILKELSELKNKSIKFFFPIEGKDHAPMQNLLKGRDIFYMANQGIMSEILGFNINIDRVIPWPKNGMISALIVAAYMGFEEIYLLGCEHNYLCYNFGTGGRPLSIDHFFQEEMDTIDTSDPEVLKKFDLEQYHSYTYETNIAHILQLFKNYRLLKKKVRRLHPNIRIFNATPNSYLDVFPPIEFKNIKLS